MGGLGFGPEHGGNMGDVSFFVGPFNFQNTSVFGSILREQFHWLSRSTDRSPCSGDAGGGKVGARLEPPPPIAAGAPGRSLSTQPFPGLAEAAPGGFSLFLSVPLLASPEVRSEGGPWEPPYHTVLPH